MANPRVEDEGMLREWAPLTDLLGQIPIKAQRGLFTQELNLTCVDALPEFLVVGTNMGLVYWYNRKAGDLQRLRFENTAVAVTCVKVISTVDYMVAAGSDQGTVTVFQIPKIPPDNLPESMRPKNNKQVERYTVGGLHTGPVTTIEWSMNGMKLFSGDKSGLVVFTEIDFYMHLSKSSEILNEKYEIVQLSYSQQLLLVSTSYRSIVCHRDDRWKVAQVGQKERKALGHLGATFCVRAGIPRQLVVYASRPGLRLWQANKTGVVEQTLIYKDMLTSPHPQAPLINPCKSHGTPGDQQFGPLHVFNERLLVTHSADVVYVLDPDSIGVVATVTELRGIQSLAVTRDEIFVLEGPRSLVRVAYSPENSVPNGQPQGGREPQSDSLFMSLPVSLSDNAALSSLLDLTYKIKDSTIPFTKISSTISRLGGGVEGDSPTVVTADEALELPPIVPLVGGALTDLAVEKPVSPAADCKTTLSLSQCDSGYDLRLGEGSLRAELLDKIGEQQFEDILFKPHRRKRSRTGRPRPLVSGTESGSDTVSMNSVHSTTSEGEDPWSSEQLDISGDLSSTSTRPDSSDYNEQITLRSSSEETLGRIDDSCTPLSTVVGVREFDEELTSQDTSRPTELPLNGQLYLPPEIKPDLRSPSSIEQAVAEKERILAKVLNLDSLCIDHKTPTNTKVISSEINESILQNGVILIGEQTNDISNLLDNKINSFNSADNNSPPSSFTEELSSTLKLDEICSENLKRTFACFDDETDSSTEVSDERVASLSSVLSYGPPSGSSAPPSINTSLELEAPEAPPATCESLTQESVQRADKWVQYKVPDSLTHLSVCRNYVCCVDSRDTVYYSALDGLGLKWHLVDYRARQVVMTQDGNLVWKLFKNVAYALETPSVKGPFGVGWVEAATDVQCVAVDDGMAWFVSLDGRVYVQKLLNPDMVCGVSTPVHCAWPVTGVCCFGGSVLVLTNTGEVLSREGSTPTIPEGKSWVKVTVPATVVTSISLGPHNTAWVVDSKNHVFFSTDYQATQPHWWQLLISNYIFQQSSSLQQFRSKLTENLRMPATAIVSASEDTVWIADKMATFVHMNKTEFSGHCWSKVSRKGLLPLVKWQQLSAEGIFEDKGQLWMLTQSGDLFCSRPNSSSLHSLPLPCNSPVICLAAAPFTVWLLTANSRVFIRQGLSDTCLDGFTWRELSLAQIEGVKLRHISCGCDAVWACDDQGSVYMAMGSPHAMADSTFSPVWIHADEKPAGKKIFFTKVYVGPQIYMVWAIDNKRNVYVREAIFHDFMLGVGWMLVSGIEATELSLSGSAVWALSPGGSVYRRHGITQNNFIGDYWKKILGSLAAITSSVSDGLWALDKNNGLLKHSLLTVRLCEKGIKIVGDCLPATDDDWEVV